MAPLGFGWIRPSGLLRTVNFIHSRSLTFAKLRQRHGHVNERLRPNKRLKLAGADRFSGIGVLCPWRGTDCVPHPCAGGRVARSLSAIR